MRKIWIASVVSAVAMSSLVLDASSTAEAAMFFKAPQKNMSLVEPAKKKRSRYLCSTFICVECCTNQTTGKETCRAICM